MKIAVAIAIVCLFFVPFSVLQANGQEDTLYCPTETPTPTNTLTPTPTSTQTPTPTSTPTSTSTPTETPTETQTPTSTSISTETPTPTPTMTQTPPLNRYYLPIVQKPYWIPIGAAVSSGNLDNPVYLNTLLANYDQFTPENEGKYWFVQAYGWHAMDEIVDLDRPVHYHSLIWNDGLGDCEWIREAMTRYPQIVDWDVSNETILPWAFSCARNVRPDATLWYNGILNTRAEQDALLEFAETGLVDAVGVQMHLDLNSDLDAYTYLLENLTIPWRISELEVSIPEFSPDNLYSQAYVYRSAVALCAEYDCLSITTWGFTDAVTWHPRSYSLPFDVNYSPKPAWFVFWR